MSDQNPYAAPASEVEQESAGDLHEPRMVGIGRGASWIGEGFEYFKQSAGAWIGVCIVGFIIMMVLSIIPVVNMISGIFAYVWVGGLMIGLRAQEDGDGFQFSHLFAGFSHRLGALVGVGAIIFFATIGIAMAAFGSMYWKMMMGDFEPSTMDFGITTFLLPMLVMMLVMIPLMMCAWFTPVLLVNHDISVFKAMSLSFKGCLKNMLPFLLYGILATVIFVVGIIPLMLGLLLVVPMMLGSIYASYKDIYIN